LIAIKHIIKQIKKYTVYIRNTQWYRRLCQRNTYLTGSICLL